MCLLFHSIAGPTPDANIVLWAGFVLGWYKRVYLPSSAPLVFVGAKLAYNEKVFEADCVYTN